MWRERKPEFASQCAAVFERVPEIKLRWLLQLLEGPVLYSGADEAPLVIKAKSGQ